MALLEQFFDQFFGIVDLSDRCDRIGAVMGSDHQGLGFKVRDTADTDITGHGVHILIELGTERSIFDVMNGTIVPLLPAEYRHTGSSRSQMGMIVCSKEKIKHAIFF